MKKSNSSRKILVLRLRYPLIKATIKALLIGVPFVLGSTASRSLYATTINSSTNPVVLQTLDPTTAIFVAPVTTTVTVSGTAISGDTSKDWQLTNNGSITANGNGNTAGILLSSATVNAALIDNFGTIKGAGQNSAGIFLANGGTVTNHNGANIGSAGFYGISSSGGPATALINVVNDGAISGSSGGVALAGGSVTQSATGTISSTSGVGILNNSGSITINNAGAISGSVLGALLRGTGVETLVNSGTISGVSSGVSLQSSGGGTLTNSGTITGTGGTAISISGSNTQVILQTGSVLNGAVTSTGAGNTLVLQGNGTASNAFSGFTTVSALDSGTWTLGGNVGTTAPSAAALNVQNGTLVITGQVTNAGAGAGSSISSGGTLQIGNGGSTGGVSGNVLVDSGGQLRFNRSDNLTYGSVISGSGGLTQAGSGTLILTGNNTYTGVTTLNGALQIGNGGTSGSITGDVSNQGQSLTFNRSDTLIYGGAISGSGRLIQSGTGTLIVTGNSAYSGSLAITSGTLQIGNGGTSGSVTPSSGVGNSGILAFDRSDALSFGSSISGTGSLKQNGSGTTTLTGNNTYTGGTTISAGALQLGNGGTAGSILGNITNNAALAFNRSDAVTYAGVVSGIGSLTQAGTGTTTLTGNNTYTGGTTVSGGTLVLGSDNTLGNTSLLALNAGTTADINGKTQTIGALGGAGTLNIDAGNLTINNGGVFSGAISGSSGALNANGGTLILTGDNTFTGGTTISAGTLQISNGGTTGSYVGDITDNAALTFNRSDTTTYAGVVSGTGSLTQAGNGTTILTGANTYTGGTTISAGTLQLGNGGTTGSVSGDITDNAALIFNRSDSVFFDSVISGTGSVTQDGTGKLVFNGIQTYSGNTNINTGTLAIGDAAHTNANLAGGGLVTVGAAGALGGYGTVTGSVINDGLIGVGNALPAFANGPDASFTVAGNLDNHGIVTMANGTAGDRMTVGGTYTSNGGKLLIDTVLNEGGAASNSDLLIAGATAVGAKGATQLTVNNIGGAGAAGVDNGIMVVQVQDPTHSAAGAFMLSGRVVAGPYEYQLFQGGEQSADGNWYLRSEAPTPPSPPTPPTPPTPPSPPLPLFRPEVAAYLANQHVAGEMFVHSLDDRASGSSSSAVNGDGSGRPGSVWLHMEGRNEGSDSSDGTFHVNTDSFLMQGGAEVAQKKLTPGADLLHLGLMATYETAQSNAEAAGNPATARGNVAGYSVGAYATWYQNDESRLGVYADTSLQYGWFNNSVSGEDLPTVNYNARGWAISGELGYALTLLNNWVVEPQGQLIYVDYQEDSLTEPNGTHVNGADSSGVITRLGLRLQRTFQRSANKKMQFYATANWWHTSTDSSISFNQIPAGSLYPANRYEVKLGLNGDLGKDWSAWSNVSGAWGAQNYHAYVVRAGVKYAW